LRAKLRQSDTIGTVCAFVSKLRRRGSEIAALAQSSRQLR